MESVAGLTDASAVSLQPTELHPQLNGSLAGPGWRVVQRVDRAEFERRYVEVLDDATYFCCAEEALDEAWDVYCAVEALEAAR